MPNYIQVSFADVEPEQSGVLIAQLSEAGFEGFEESEKTLHAFIPESVYDKALLNSIASKYDLSFEEKLIPEQNWNAVWESNFDPVIVDDFVAVRADFHQSATGVEQEIIITPKMSFGTGHHATTYMMMQQMRSIDFTGRSVFDFGTGTGVLSILAEKLGAAHVMAIDNDDWSIANTAENIERNNCSKIELKKADTIEPGKKYDIVLANINRNVILENFPSLVELLHHNGILLFSGLVEADEAVICEATAGFPLVLNCKTAKNGWIALRFDY